VYEARPARAHPGPNRHTVASDALRGRRKHTEPINTGRVEAGPSAVEAGSRPGADEAAPDADYSMRA